MTIRCLGTLACLFAYLAVASSLSAAVDIVEGKTTLTASAGGRPLLLYRKASPTAMKPYIQELYTPGGVQVLRDSVPDHKHHHGMMFAVAADGVNFWEEGGAGSCPLGNSVPAEPPARTTPPCRRISRLAGTSLPPRLARSIRRAI